ncbi:hypothetical protein FQN53_004908 [Emmonsiellopsis sp. PD_33]|nr:hypothetical protein FQN53_004908 [Emmonsiellopsis sp. PD_33]
MAAPLWPWKRLASDIISSNATSSLQYLPPGYHCSVDYPSTITPNGTYGAIYSHDTLSGHTGPFFSFDATIWNAFGTRSLRSTAFITPSRRPVAPLNRYHAKWDTELNAYVVTLINTKPSSQSLSKSVFESILSPNLNGSSTRIKPNDQEKNRDNHPADNVEELFEIEYIPQAVNEYWEDQSQYELGLFAVRDLDTVPELVSGSVSTVSCPSIPEPTDIEELLRVENFVWADEFDSEVQWLQQVDSAGTDIESALPELLKLEDFDWADEVEAFAKEEKEKLQSSVVDSVAEDVMHQDPLNHLPVTHNGLIRASLQEGTTSSECADLSPESIPKCPSENTESLDIAVRTPPPCQFLDEEEVPPEPYQTDQFHHYNWLRHPVMERSYTAPEVSLFVILTDPKPFFYNWIDGSWKGVTLQQALKFVDPILYCGGWEDLRLSGHQLVKAITGQAFQFYTEDGTWQGDPTDPDTPEPLLDPLNMDLYLRGPWLPLNGWVETPLVRTRYEYVDEAKRLFDERRSPRRGKPETYIKSPLSQCTAVAELEDEDGGDSSPTEWADCSYPLVNSYAASEPCLSDFSDVEPGPFRRTRSFELDRGTKGPSSPS